MTMRICRSSIEKSADEDGWLHQEYAEVYQEVDRLMPQKTEMIMMEELFYLLL